MRRAMLTAGGKKKIISLPAIGDPFYGGYYAGIIDTTRGNIIPTDTSQVGLRYALIISPKSLETTAIWRSVEADDLFSRTRWDGLASTQAMVSSSATFPAAEYCAGLAAPGDGASSWYLPALDELSLIYFNLKPTTDNNRVGDRGGNWPPPKVPHGENISSDPSWAGNTSTTPAQTTAVVFRNGGSEALSGSPAYWTSTEYTTTSAWVQYATGILSGTQSQGTKTSSANRVRPVRRLVL